MAWRVKEKKAEQGGKLERALDRIHKGPESVREGRRTLFPIEPVC